MPVTNTVWVIEQGQYSDYRVLGVYSTKANAETVAAFLAREWSGPTVAEWPLDPGVDELAQGHQVYSISMSVDGNNPAVRNCDYGVPEQPDGLYVSGPVDGPKFVDGSVWASDEVHAVKIANEYRIQAIADGRLD